MKALWGCGCGARSVLGYGPQHVGPQCPNAYGSHPVHRSSSSGRLHFIGWCDDEGDLLEDSDG